MESRLVKILDDDFDIGGLSEENIEEYVQTKESKKTYQKRIIQPYEVMATSLGISPVYEDGGLVLSLKRRSAAQKYSDKQIVDLTETYLDTMGLVNGQGQQAYGIRRFKDSVAIDVVFLQELIDHWSGIVFGYKESTTIKSKGDIDDIVMKYAPSLALRTSSYVPDATEDAAKLYITAKAVSEKLTKKVIRPFEKAFKAQARTDPEKTVFDTRAYGRLAVQVKTVPRQEPDYKMVKEILMGYLALHESTDMADDKVTFLNTAVDQPRIYMDIQHIHDHIYAAKEKTVFKQRQEISILYNPADAIVISS